MFIGIGPIRHLLALIVCAVASVAGVIVASYFIDRERSAFTQLDGADWKMWALGIAMLVLFVLALLSVAVSPAAGILVGVLVGLVPGVWYMADQRSFSDLIDTFGDEARDRLVLLMSPSHYLLIFLMLAGAGLAALLAGRGARHRRRDADADADAGTGVPPPAAAPQQVVPPAHAPPRPVAPPQDGGQPDTPPQHAAPATHVEPPPRQV